MKIMNNKIINYHTGRQFQAGASLLEVLVTILIMSFGMLAFGGLTAAALQYSKMAQYQTIGTQLAAEYGDRMRGNVDGFRANNYNQTTPYAGVSSLVSVPACATATKCTSAELAAIDVAEWTNSLRQRLPGGGAYVTHSDANNTLAADIWVMWSEPNLKYAVSNNDLSVSSSGGSQCPDAALAGLPASIPTPRCMYFRMSL